MRELTPPEVRALLDSAATPPLLLDVREAWEFEICHLPDALNIPMAAVTGANLDPTRETVVICHHGMRSYQVALWLERQGFQQVINLSGGMDAWAELLEPDMARY